MSDIVELKEDVSTSELFSEDLAPVPKAKRTWNLWNIAAIWVGMAVCIPTYILASYMIKDGLGWDEALAIIFVANLIVTIPMIFNGHAGVKYGIPFPVLGRASFGTWGVHVPSLVRALVACGWFGIQTWIGGLAIYAIWCAITGTTYESGLTLGTFICFAIFWVKNLYFVWKGTESIRLMETLAAPVLLLIGVLLIVWGATKGGGFGNVLAQNAQMQRATAQLVEGPGGELALRLRPLTDLDGTVKATRFCAALGESDLVDRPWTDIPPDGADIPLADLGIAGDAESVAVQLGAGETVSSVVIAKRPATGRPKWLVYIGWLTAMVGFWATMSISISDITRYAHNQREQVIGQLLGLPGTMLLYSFVGVFVTCAALVIFGDVLIAEDAPWDPVSLLARFDHPGVVIVAQIAMLIATLSTNIAANVIAPANAFANAFPRRISFAGGGLITGIVGIVLCPWWIINEISGLLITVSGFLGPVLGVMLADYFLVRGTKLDLAELFKTGGIYSYTNGINPSGIVALLSGVVLALIGYVYQPLDWLYNFSWFIGFGVSFVFYTLLMKGKTEPHSA